MITHRMMTVNGIEMHVAEAGEGPLVVLLHGFPELWYSYRHQLEALAAAGYHAVAPDQRGYGRTAAPDDVGKYTLVHLGGDVVALVSALGEEDLASWSGTIGVRHWRRPWALSARPGTRCGAPQCAISASG